MNIKFKKIYFLIMVITIYPVFICNSHGQKYQEFNLTLQRKTLLKDNINKAIEEQKNIIRNTQQNISLKLENKEIIIEEAADILMALEQIKEELSL